MKNNLYLIIQSILILVWFCLSTTMCMADRKADGEWLWVIYIVWFVIFILMIIVHGLSDKYDKKQRGKR